MIWQNPHILWLLAVIPLLLAGQWLYKNQQKDKRKDYFDESLFNKLYRGFWQTGSRVKTACLYGALAFFIVAAAGPKIGTEVKQIKREGIELLIALDLSASMNAEDIEPSRLAKAKYEISRLLDQLQGDRVGLIVFTGTAYLQVPFTTDYGALRMFLDILQTDQMPNTATDIRSAMRLAAQTFADETEAKDNSKAAEILLIISDGENHGDSYKKALNRLLQQGVTVFTMGVGTEQGGTIPIYNDKGMLTGYQKNEEGKIVVTKLMPKVLKNIAQKGGGEYYQLSNLSSAVDNFLKDIKNLEQGTFASKRYVDYENQYRIFALIGLGLLLVSMLFPRYKRKKQDFLSTKLAEKG